MATDLDTLTQAVGDRYVIERELGRGGMATVYLARDVKHKRLVALKVLRQDVSAAVGAERFMREIEIAARLQHPHILPLHDSGDLGGALFYVMPYVEGESLRSRLNRERVLPLADALSIAREVADALDYAHRHGVIHRDIKPENILLSGTHAVVADFGVARAITQAGTMTLTVAGIVVGTPAYMAPEQALAGDGVDGRADIYALGCVLYECLAGAPPFVGPSAAAVLTQQITGAPPDVRRTRSDAPAWLEAAIRRALAKEPSARFASSSEFAAALAPSAVRRSAALRWSVPKLAGTRSRALLIAAALVVAVAGAGLARHWLSQRSAPIRSLAVLPFENESPEPGSEYFADGMTEELIGAFRRAAGLRVPPRSSVFALKGLKVPGREKGRRLNVDVVLEGTVFRSASLVRLYAELVDVAADTTIWSETLENQVGDPLIIQNKLASEIMARLGPRLRIAGSGNLMRQGTRDPKAYDLYLQGRYAMGPRTHDGLMHAIELFKQAVARDSSYALAYSGLADAYGLVAGYSGALSPAEGFERGRDAANRALSLDSTSAAAHTSVAFMSLFYLYKWADAERDLSAAVASDSAYTFAHVIRGWMFSITGRSTLGIRELERARQLEPLSPLVNTRLGSLLYYAGDTDGAVRQLRSTLATDSTYTLAHAELAHVLAAQGKVDEALAELAKAPDFTYRYEAAPVIYAVARAGRAAEARRMLASRLGQMDRTHIDAAGTALVYVGLGDTTEAFRWLDRAMQDRPWSLSLLRIEPLWRPIASDPRFVAHLKQLQLATGS